MYAYEKIKIGDHYGRLTVIDTPFKIKNRWKVTCRCNCGSDKIVTPRIESLINGNTKSCGCLNKEHMIKLGKSSHRVNDYDLSGDFGIGYTANYNRYHENYFWFDLEDYEKIQPFCWCFDKDGYLMSIINRVNVKMHRLIMNCPQGLEVDHIMHRIDGGGTENDNRKQNLRICTHKVNCKHRLIKRQRSIIYTPQGFQLYEKNKELVGVFQTYQDAYNYKIGAKE